jgi:hypothetical protein
VTLFCFSNLSCLEKRAEDRVSANSSFRDRNCHLFSVTSRAETSLPVPEVIPAISLRNAAWRQASEQNRFRLPEVASRKAVPQCRHEDLDVILVKAVMSLFQWRQI